MEFNPKNHIIQLCVTGTRCEENGASEDAAILFLQAWEQSSNDFEKFIAAHFVARNLIDPAEKLKWQQTALHFAQCTNDETVKTAFPSLYKNIAKSYEGMGDERNASMHNELADSFTDIIYDHGPFYHGTKADLQIGDLLIPGNLSNYSNDLLMNHIYFTALVNGAGLAASLAKGDGPERIYIIQPTGTFENDPNVTDKKFPGNLTRSYRSAASLRIIGEITDWSRNTQEDINKWRSKLEENTGTIIN